MEDSRAHIDFVVLQDAHPNLKHVEEYFCTGHYFTINIEQLHQLFVTIEIYITLSILVPEGLLCKISHCFFLWEREGFCGMKWNSFEKSSMLESSF
jgi:hypothetical protein